METYSLVGNYWVVIGEVWVRMLLTALWWFPIFFLLFAFLLPTDVSIALIRH